MNQSQMTKTYLDILFQGLKRKELILEKIYVVTNQQGIDISANTNVIEMMEDGINQKEPLIAELNELDLGFSQLYGKVKEQIITDKDQYQTIIEQIQKKIQTVSELSMRIQGLEKNNKLKFEIYLSEKKTEIKQFKQSNRTVSNYYKNMTGKPQGESYFIDKKN